MLSLVYTAPPCSSLIWRHFFHLHSPSSTPPPSLPCNRGPSVQFWQCHVWINDHCLTNPLCSGAWRSWQVLASQRLNNSYTNLRKGQYSPDPASHQQVAVIHQHLSRRNLRGEIQLKEGSRDDMGHDPCTYNADKTVNTDSRSMSTPLDGGFTTKAS